MEILQIDSFSNIFTNFKILNLVTIQRLQTDPLQARQTAFKWTGRSPRKVLATLLT